MSRPQTKTQTYSCFPDGPEVRHIWDVPRLWGLSSVLDVFDFNISKFSGMDIDMWFCDVHIPTVRNVYEHCMRIQNASLDYPIMLAPNGFVLDGVHRLLKAKTLGHTTVKAVQFKIMPEVDRTERRNKQCQKHK